MAGDGAAELGPGVGDVLGGAVGTCLHALGGGLLKPAHLEKT